MKQMLILLITVLMLGNVVNAQTPLSFEVMVGVVKAVSPKLLNITKTDGTIVTFNLSATTQIVKEKGDSISSGGTRRNIVPGDRVRILHNNRQAYNIYIETQK